MFRSFFSLLLMCLLWVCLSGQDEANLFLKSAPAAIYKKIGHQLTLMPNFGQAFDAHPVMGFGIKYDLVYSIDRVIDLGIGTGIEAFDFKDGEAVIPVTGSVDLYMKRGRISPFVRVGAGYGFVIDPLTWADLKKTGGMLTQAMFGAKFGAKSTAFLMGIGYRQQPVSTHTRSVFIWEPGSYELQKIYRRLTFQAGVAF